MSDRSITETEGLFATETDVGGKKEMQRSMRGKTSMGGKAFACTKRFPRSASLAILGMGTEVAGLNFQRMFSFDGDNHMYKLHPSGSVDDGGHMYRAVLQPKGAESSDSDSSLGSAQDEDPDSTQGSTQDGVAQTNGQSSTQGKEVGPDSTQGSTQDGGAQTNGQGSTQGKEVGPDSTLGSTQDGGAQTLSDLPEELLGRIGSFGGSDKLTNTDKAIRDSMRNAGLDLQFAYPKLKANPEWVLAAVTLNGLALQFAHDDLKKDHSVVLAAVNQNGLALQFASNDLKDNYKVVFAAVTQNGLALRFASDTLKRNYRVFTQADAALQATLTWPQWTERKVLDLTGGPDGSEWRYTIGALSFYLLWFGVGTPVTGISLALLSLAAEVSWIHYGTPTNDLYL